MTSKKKSHRKRGCVPTSFDCPQGLKEAFMKLAREEGRDMCQDLRSFMAWRVYNLPAKHLGLHSRTPKAYQNTKTATPLRVSNKPRKTSSGDMCEEYVVPLGGKARAKVRAVLGLGCFIHGCPDVVVAAATFLPSGRVSLVCLKHLKLIEGHEKWRVEVDGLELLKAGVDKAIVGES